MCYITAAVTELGNANSFQGGQDSLPGDISVNYKSCCFLKTCLSEFLQLKRGMNEIKQGSYLVSKKYSQT